MTATTPKRQPLTAENSDLYIATKAPKGGSHQDTGATAIRFRALNADHAQSLCKQHGLHLDGLHIVTHKWAHIAWHVRESSSDGQTSYRLYYYNLLIDTSKGAGSKPRFNFIAKWLNKNSSKPNRLCAADFPTLDSAQKSFNK